MQIYLLYYLFIFRTKFRTIKQKPLDNLFIIKGL